MRIGERRDAAPSPEPPAYLRDIDDAVPPSRDEDRGLDAPVEREGAIDKGDLSPTRISKKDAAIWGLLIYSTALTLAVTGWVAKKGGPRYVLEQTGLIRHGNVPAGWQVDWIARNRALPNTESEVVFAGDSLTAAMPWAEYYSDVRNRGIGGDNSAGLLDRIDEVSESFPRQVFINIGSNDLSREVPTGEVAENIRRIVGEIRSRSGATEVYVVSVLPINPDFQPGVRGERKSGEIPRLNRLLEEGQERHGYRFVDISGRFADGRGYLRRELTHDGIHLNDAGNRLYCESLMPHVRTKELIARRRRAAPGASGGGVPGRGTESQLSPGEGS